MKKLWTESWVGTPPGWAAGWTNRAARNGNLPVTKVQFISGQWQQAKTIILFNQNSVVEEVDSTRYLCW